MIIFLDVDGVLNQLQRNHLDDRCIDCFGVLCKKLGASVVLTSSWRKGYSNLGRCSPQVESLKEKFTQRGISISGRTTDLHDRTAEIKDYILRHKIDRYLVLDDDKGEFKSGVLPSTYFTNPKTGLTKEDINKILRRI